MAITSATSGIGPNSWAQSVQRCALFVVSLHLITRLALLMQGENLQKTMKEVVSRELDERAVRLLCNRGLLTSDFFLQAVSEQRTAKKFDKLTENMHHLLGTKAVPGWCSGLSR